jgi:hypothetical protein
LVPAFSNPSVCSSVGSHTPILRKFGHTDDAEDSIN